MAAHDPIDLELAALREAATILEDIAYRLAGRADPEIVSSLIGLSAKTISIECALKPKDRVN